MQISRNSYSTQYFIIILLLFASGCASVKKLAIEKDIQQLINQSEVFSSQFTGFSLYDLEAQEYIAGQNSTLRFTPASNTKLLTMYTVLKSFGDSIPALMYTKTDSILFVQPIGDPTFLYEPFANQAASEFLAQFDKIHILWPKQELKPFGPGWAWDDYVYNFQPQRSWWPAYGNSVNIQKVNDSLTITPSFFEDYVEVLKQERPGELVDRELKFNVFKAYLESDTTNFQRIIPFEYSKELLIQLLQDTLNANIAISNESIDLQDTLYAQHTDTVLAKMMKPSDNFLAEQLLIMAAKWNGHGEVNPLISQIKNTWLADLNDFVWVDGSGLSRYNPIAPVDQVRLLKKCHDEFGWSRITQILPSGGEGTLEELYLTEDEESSFLFAKTGTLSNNHNLSGYLVTNSGNRMIFSFMNNHYVRPSLEVKKAMEKLLLEIKEAY